MTDKTGPEVRVETLSLHIADVDHAQMRRLAVQPEPDLLLMIGDFFISASEDDWLKISSMVRAMVANSSRRGVSAGDV